MSSLIRFTILLIALSEVFCDSEEEDRSYLVAILNKFAFVSNGVLVRDDWVLTDANSIFGLHHIKKLLRVRIGSNNYKKGGVAVPVKDIEYHPYFKRNRAQFDVALVQLTDYEAPNPVFPVRLLKRQQNVTRSHMTVVSWIRPYRASTAPLTPGEVELSRLSTLAHLQPYPAAECGRWARGADLVCLDPGVKITRHSGAPVTVNNVLWAVVSSCPAAADPAAADPTTADPTAADPTTADPTTTDPAGANRSAGLEPPLLANQVAAKSILGWVYATIRRRFWDPKRSRDFVPYDDEDDDALDENDMSHLADTLFNKLENDGTTQANATDATEATVVEETEVDVNGLGIPDASNSSDSL